MTSDRGIEFLVSTFWLDHKKRYGKSPSLVLNRVRVLGQRGEISKQGSRWEKTLNILPLCVLCNQCEQLMLCCLKQVILEKRFFYFVDPLLNSRRDL